MSRATWTDERLDGFTRDVDRRFGEVDRRFEEVDRRFDRVDREMHDLRLEMRDGFDRIDARFDRMDARFDFLQRMTIQVGGGLFATFAVGFIGLVVTQA